MAHGYFHFLASRRRSEIYREKQYQRIKALFLQNSVDERLVDEKEEQRDAAIAAENAAQASVLTAKALATIDVLSKGRVTLGVGVGWMREEFEALGAPEFDRRGAVTDEYIRIFKTFWTQSPASFSGRFYRFDALEANPRPPAPIPIWVGGISDAALRRAARNDGWLSDLQSTSEIEVCIDKVRRYRAEQGRAGEFFDVMASASDAFTLEGYRRLAKIGVTHVLTLPWIFTHGDTKVLREKKEGMRRFAEDVIAKI